MKNNKKRRKKNGKKGSNEVCKCVIPQIKNILFRSVIENKNAHFSIESLGEKDYDISLMTGNNNKEGGDQK